MQGTYVDMWTGAAGDRTTSPVTSGRAALPPELQTQNKFPEL